MPHPTWGFPPPDLAEQEPAPVVCSECQNECTHLLRCQGDRCRLLSAPESHHNDWLLRPEEACESSLCQDCVCFLVDTLPDFAHACTVGDAASRAVRVRERVWVPTLAFFMSQHRRLGARAIVPELDDIVLSLIGQYVSLNAEDSLPWAGKRASPPGEEEELSIEVWDLCNDCSVPLCPHCWYQRFDSMDVHGNGGGVELRLCLECLQNRESDEDRESDDDGSYDERYGGGIDIDEFDYSNSSSNSEDIGEDEGACEEGHEEDDEGEEEDDENDDGD